MSRSPLDRDPTEPPAPGRIGARRAGAWALLCLLCGWASQPAPAAAQVVEAWTHASTVDPSGSPFSARLQAMGSLQTAVEAPQDRISTYGFSKNPAGLLSDEDSSTVEVPWHAPGARP